jgi:GT2 family glycosyltransferase
MADAPRVECVVVTFDALPWIERALASTSGIRTVVVDNGSRDGTPAFVRERFPGVTVIEQENRGLCAGWNRGLAATRASHVLVLNADAWLLENGLEALLDTADRHPRAGVVVPRLENPDGTLQRSVRGFPSVWRIATEYLYFRKLGPRTRALNAFYAAGFAHDEERVVDWAMGACMLLRRAALDDVGSFDERFFLFSEETDWMRRAADRGWSCVFTPSARCVHVGGASHGGRLWQENVKGLLRYLTLHEGRRSAERARRILRLGVTLRGWARRGEAGAQARDVARWLASGPVERLLDG